MLEHKNYERELKYLLEKDYKLSFEKIMDFFVVSGYVILETRLKKKQEEYYDDESFSLIKRGDVMRNSTHINEQDTYYHFMYKKNASDSSKPYVSKYEFGSGQFNTIHEFITELAIDVEVQPAPVLYADMTRETAIVEKERHKLLVSYDDVKYYSTINDKNVCEKMLEIEEWTTPNTLTSTNAINDIHLCEINATILRNNRFLLRLTKHSKPFRGLTLLGCEK